MRNEDGSVWTRRRFLLTTAASAVAARFMEERAPAQTAADRQEASDRKGYRPAAGPVIVASANGLRAVEKALAMIREKADPLDAVIAGVNIVEDDPNDMTVGLGGLPNEDGVVELDSCCMHGPTHKAGGVAAIRNIRNPSCVARLVLQRTDHVLLVGEGALRFAKAHGFKEENLLTDAAREAWLRWKETLSDQDDWLSPEEAHGEPSARGRDLVPHTYGTINCCAVDARGDLAGVTTTSGLSYKIPGRVGDSPIIGAGLYVDNGVGAAGSTGRGEANLLNCSSFMIVELMRGGASAEAACLEELKRIADRAEPRLRDKQGRAAFDLSFYAVAKDGRYGSASMWSGGEFCVCDAKGARREPSAYLYKSPPKPTSRPA